MHGAFPTSAHSLTGPPDTGVPLISFSVVSLLFYRASCRLRQGFSLIQYNILFELLSRYL